MRECPPPVRMLIIRKHKRYMPPKMWRKVTAFTLLVGMTVSAAIWENTMEVPQRIENTLSAIFSPDMYQKEMNLSYKIDICMPVYCSNIHKSQEKETT